MPQFSDDVHVQGAATISGSAQATTQILKQASGQSAPFLEFEDSNGNVLSQVNADGTLSGAAANEFVAKSLVTAAGDLVVATGAGAVERLAKGTAGQVLTVGGADPSGIEWAAAPGGGNTPGSTFRTSTVYPIGTVDGSSSSSETNGQECAYPFDVAASVTAVKIGVWVTSAGSTGAVYRLGIRNDGGGKPGSLLIDAGTVAATATGFVTIAISQPLAPGRYWTSVTPQGSPTTLPHAARLNANGPSGSSGQLLDWNGTPSVSNQNITALAQTGVTGALPAAFTIGSPVGAAGTPLVYLGF